MMTWLHDPNTNNNDFGWCTIFDACCNFPCQNPDEIQLFSFWNFLHDYLDQYRCEAPLESFLEIRMIYFQIIEYVEFIQNLPLNFTFFLIGIYHSVWSSLLDNFKC